MGLMKITTTKRLTIKVKWHTEKVGASKMYKKKGRFWFCAVCYWQRKLFVKGVGGLMYSAVMDCELPEPELLS